MMFSVSQKIELEYDGKKLWFDVCRYNTPSELQLALTKASARDFNAKTTAYTELFKEGLQCGRIHLLDSSTAVIAREASKMAFWISIRSGNNELNSDFMTDHNAMVGYIVSKIYSKSKYF